MTRHPPCGRIQSVVVVFARVLYRSRIINTNRPVESQSTRRFFYLLISAIAARTREAMLTMRLNNSTFVILTTSLSVSWEARTPCKHSESTYYLLIIPLFMCSVKANKNRFVAISTKNIKGCFPRPFIFCSVFPLIYLGFPFNMPLTFIAWLYVVSPFF